MSNSVTYCKKCQEYSHWIELQLVNEHAKPFADKLSGILKTKDGAERKVTLNQGYLFAEFLPSGPVQLFIPTDELLKAAYAHSPRKKEAQNPVSVYTKKEKGHENKTREYEQITVGDIWEKEPEQPVAERHRPGAANGKLVLVVDNSYVLEVRAFNMLTVRIGMFFDGTGNNTYNADLAKEQTSIWASRCEKPEQSDVLSKWCGASPSQGSAGNEITNVQKLYDFYDISTQIENNMLITKQYVEGIGTTNDGSSSLITDDSKYGMATGTGDTGVDGKVKHGSEAVAVNIKDKIPDGYDGIGCFQFDVFGFSRGAAAARHFVNVVIQGANGYFGNALKTQIISLPQAFDWNNPQQCQFAFVGVFDTVAAILDPVHGDITPSNNYNPGIHLSLPVKQTLRAVHITAADEFRDYFALNQLNSAPQFLEISVPGAHPDIGGGYYSRYYLNNQNPQSMSRALQEDIIVSAYSCSMFMYPNDESIKRSSAWRKAEKDKNRLIIDGWANESAIQIDYRITQQNHKSADTYMLSVKVTMKRIVEGDLSRIHLRLMYGLAQHAKVPLVTFDEFNANTKVSDELKEIAHEILMKAKQGLISPNMMSMRAYLRSRYIHYSANLNLVKAGIHPNAPTNNNQRHIYACEEN